MRVHSRWHLAFVAMLGAMLLLVAACGEDDNDTNSSQEDEPLTGSPTSLASRSEDTEQINLQIENGELSDDGIELQEDEAYILLIANQDNVAYTLNLGDLVTETAIPASQETKIEFTAPVEGEYEGELTAEGGGDPLDTMTVRVEPPEQSSP